jgi:hypothetical protein
MDARLPASIYGPLILHRGTRHFPTLHRGTGRIPTLHRGTRRVPTPKGLHISAQGCESASYPGSAIQNASEP